MVSEEEIKNKILSKLEEVIDPEIGVDVVNLGLIYSIDIDLENKKGRVKMTATTPTCPLLGELLSEVQAKLSEIEELDEIAVEITWDPPWTPERMSKKAKELLGME